MFAPSQPLSFENCSIQLVNIEKEEEKELSELSNQLMKELNELRSKESKYVKLLQSNKDSIDFNKEVESVKKEFKNKFVALTGRLKAISDKTGENNKLTSDLKIAMIKSRTFGQDQKALLKVIDSIKMELDTSNQLIAKLQEEDLKVLFAEETLLSNILEQPLIRIAKDNEMVEQNQLHLKVLGGLHIKSGIHHRLSMIEFEMQSSLRAIQLSNELTKAGVSKSDIEQKLRDLSNEKKYNMTSVLASLQTKFTEQFSFEKKRQESAETDFEAERSRALDQNALTEMKEVLSMQKSLRSIKNEYRVALEEKKKIMIDENDIKIQNEETKRIVLNQIEAESIRDDLDLQIAYDS
jgi:hypothetical protein